MLASIIPRQPDMVAEFVNGVIGATILIAAFPLVIPEIIDLTNQAATAIGKTDLSAYVSHSEVRNPLIQVVVDPIKGVAPDTCEVLQRVHMSDVPCATSRQGVCDVAFS